MQHEWMKVGSFALKLITICMIIKTISSNVSSTSHTDKYTGFFYSPKTRPALTGFHGCYKTLNIIFGQQLGEKHLN